MFGDERIHHGRGIAGGWRCGAGVLSTARLYTTHGRLQRSHFALADIWVFHVLGNLDSLRLFWRVEIYLVTAGRGVCELIRTFLAILILPDLGDMSLAGRSQQHAQSQL